MYVISLFLHKLELKVNNQNTMQSADKLEMHTDHKQEIL